MNAAAVIIALAGMTIIGMLLERMWVARKQAEQRMVVERLQQNGRLRDDVVATISHQLKTPLTSVLGYASLIKRKLPELSPEQIREYTDVIEAQTMKVTRLVEDLLQSSRMEHTEGSQRTRIDLQAIVRANARDLGEARGRAIEVIAPSHDLELWGDRGALDHIIGNLLDNALKYSEDGTPVIVTIAEIGGEVQVSVRDDGVGIAAEELPLIFERFRRATTAPSARASVGLGLFIVRNLVAAHGGRVWAESEPGKGTTISFTLPRRRR